MIQLKDKAICIHCWSEFDVGNLLWVSEHEDLKGDLLLKDQPIRFLPSRFNASGNAIDALGQECQKIACPKCHLEIPRAIIERKIIFVSILGSPQSGKSYYLASLINRVRTRFPKYFGYNVNDANLNDNAVLNRYEKELFLRSDKEELFVLGDLIPKTQLGGLLYNSVNYGNQVTNYPRPFTFNFDSRNGASNGSAKSMLCLYDNAGEHYEAGRDSNQEPGTRHMAMADFLLFIYDPTQDSRWEPELNKETVAKHFSSKTNFQEHILLEAANRIRSLNGIPDGARISKPLFVVVCKLDVWKKELPQVDWSSPLKRRKNGVALDVAKFLEQSQLMKKKLETVIPTIVNAAESVSDSVYFVPVSALGKRPEHFSNDGKAMIRTADIRPHRVELPLIAGLALSNSGIVKLVR